MSTYLHTLTKSEHRDLIFTIKGALLDDVPISMEDVRALDRQFNPQNTKITDIKSLGKRSVFVDASRGHLYALQAFRNEYQSLRTFCLTARVWVDSLISLIKANAERFPDLQDLLPKQMSVSDWMASLPTSPQVSNKDYLAMVRTLLRVYATLRTGPSSIPHSAGKDQQKLVDRLMKYLNSSMRTIDPYVWKNARPYANHRSDQCPIVLNMTILVCLHCGIYRNGDIGRLSYISYDLLYDVFSQVNLHDHQVAMDTDVMSTYFPRPATEVTELRIA